MRLALLISVSREWKDGWMTGDGRGAAPSSLEVAIQRALGRYYSGALQRSIGEVAIITVAVVRLIIIPRADALSGVRRTVHLALG